MTTTVELKNLAPGTTTPTTGNSASCRTALKPFPADGGVPIMNVQMNVTIRLRW